MKNDARKRIEDDIALEAPQDDIQCKDCAFRKPDLVENGKVIVQGYKNGYCKVYEPGKTNGKPNGVLFRNEKCEYYMKDEGE